MSMCETTTRYMTTLRQGFGLSSGAADERTPAAGAPAGVRYGGRRGLGSGTCLPRGRSMVPAHQTPCGATPTPAINGGYSITREIVYPVKVRRHTHNRHGFLPACRTTAETLEPNRRGLACPGELCSPSTPRQRSPLDSAPWQTSFGSSPRHEQQVGLGPLVIVPHATFTVMVNRSRARATLPRCRLCPVRSIPACAA